MFQQYNQEWELQLALQQSCILAEQLEAQKTAIRQSKFLYEMQIQPTKSKNKKQQSLFQTQQKQPDIKHLEKFQKQIEKQTQIKIYQIIPDQHQIQDNLVHKHMFTGMGYFKKYLSKSLGFTIKNNNITCKNVTQYKYLKYFQNKELPNLLKSIFYLGEDYFVYSSNNPANLAKNIIKYGKIHHINFKVQQLSDQVVIIGINQNDFNYQLLNRFCLFVENTLALVEQKKQNIKQNFIKSLEEFEMTNFEKIFTCPITKKVFTDPVIAHDGGTYERIAIEDWFKHSLRSPITHEVLLNKTLIPNLSIKNIILELKIASNKD